MCASSMDFEGSSGEVSDGNRIMLLETVRSTVLAIKWQRT